MGFLKKIDPDFLMWVGYSGMFFFMPVATSPTVICGGFVLIVWLVSGRFLAHIRLWKNSGLAVPIMLLIILPWAGLIYTPLPADGFPIAFKTHYWLYAVALAPVLRKQKAPDLVIRMFMAGLSLNSAVSMLQFSGIIPLKKGLAAGLLGGSSAHIAYSLLLAAGILFASFYFFKARSLKGKVLCGAVMLQYFVALSFIGGRSGYLAFIVLSPLIIYNITGQKQLFRILLVTIIAIAVLFASPIVRSRFLQAKEDVLSYKKGDINTSVGARFHMWGIALSEIKKSPVFGMGTGGFTQSWEMNKKDPALPSFNHPHNSFLYMMVSFGIAGLVSFCWLLFVMVKKGWQGRHTAPGFAVFVFSVVFIIGSLTDTQVLPFATAIALPLFAGLAEAADINGRTDI